MADRRAVDGSQATDITCARALEVEVVNVGSTEATPSGRGVGQRIGERRASPASLDRLSDHADRGSGHRGVSRLHRDSADLAVVPQSPSRFPRNGACGRFAVAPTQPRSGQRAVWWRTVAR